MKPEGPGHSLGSLMQVDVAAQWTAPPLKGLQLRIVFFFRWPDQSALFRRAATNADNLPLASWRALVAGETWSFEYRPGRPGGIASRNGLVTFTTAMEDESGGSVIDSFTLPLERIAAPLAAALDQCVDYAKLGGGAPAAWANAVPR